MSIKCIKCKEEINPLRIKALPNTKVCVQCSTASAYCGVTTTHGSGDHTWNDIQLMTVEQYQTYQQLESTHNRKGKKSTPDFDDDRNLQGPFTIIEDK